MDNGYIISLINHKFIHPTGAVCRRTASALGLMMMSVGHFLRKHTHPHDPRFLFAHWPAHWLAARVVGVPDVCLFRLCGRVVVLPGSYPQAGYALDEDEDKDMDKHRHASPVAIVSWAFPCSARCRVLFDLVAFPTALALLVWEYVVDLSSEFLLVADDCIFPGRTVDVAISRAYFGGRHWRIFNCISVGFISE